MHLRFTGEPHNEEAEGILPVVAVVLVLVAVVILFLMFKYNLFNGGTPPNVRDTLPPGPPMRLMA